MNARAEVESELIQALGHALSDMLAIRGPGLLLYAEPDDSHVEAAIFAGDDEEMTLLAPTTEINLLVRDLWRLRADTAPAQAWAAMTYILLGQDFRVEYILPANLDPGLDANARCKAALRRLLGEVRVR